MKIQSAKYRKIAFGAYPPICAYCGFGCDYCRKPLEVNSYDHCVHCGAPSENFDNDALYERMTREFSHAD